jgi:hypothetical protein
MIKKRNLDPSLVSWLMTVTGLGPGIGKVVYAVPDSSSSDQYRAWLRYLGVLESEMFTTTEKAYTSTVTNRNDVVLKTPGLETVTASLAWSKNRTHLVGLGGQQHKGYESGTGLTTTTANVGSVINNTGVNNQFVNITLMNNCADADNVTAFLNAGYGTRLIGSQFIGCAAATQASTALNSSLRFNANGYYFYAEKCNFGSTDIGTLGADTACVIHFAADAMVSDGKFVECNIGAQIDATTRPLIYVSTNGIDRDWIFDRCEFYAYSANHGYKMAQVVTNQAAVPSTYDMVFKDCCAINITAYRTASNGCTWASGGGAGAAKTGVAVVTT